MKIGIFHPAIGVLILTLVCLSGIAGQPVIAGQPPTVEGVWEVVSTSVPGLSGNIGRRLSIARKGDAYEVIWADAQKPAMYAGDDRRIMLTDVEDLVEPDDVHGAGASIPARVKQQAAGKKVPINFSYTVMGDGNALLRAQDGRWVYWDDQQNYTHYEIKPNFYTVQFRRVSGPVRENPVAAPEKALSAAAKSFPVAQIESRGEFYVLTKAGRKLTGKDAGQIALEEGTKVITGSTGHVRMQLPDDTAFTVGPNSDVVIDKFVYDPESAPRTIIASMSKGVFRWVTGKVARKDPGEMKVTLPVADLGIRGTDFEVTVESDGSGVVTLQFGQLEITEKKTGFKFLLEAGHKVTFGADGSMSRPIKMD